jgi:hypothetical protein
MASFFRNKVINEIGSTPVTALATAPNSRFTVIGLSLANLTEGIVLVDVQLEDDEGTVGYYAKQILIPPNSSLRLINGGEKLILAESNLLYIKCNVPDGVDAVISYVELI